MPNEEEEGQVHSFHTEGGSVIFDKPDDKEALRQKRESEGHEFARDQVKSSRHIAWFNGLLVVATFCSIVIGVWQAYISRTAATAAKDAAETATKTLNELQHGSGANDTRTLAQHAVTQAIQTTNLASSTQYQADQTKRLADEALKQVRASNTLAIQAQRSADFSKLSIDTAVDAERPWLGLSLSVLDFETGKSPVLLVSIQNSGRRPALLNVDSIMTTFPSFPVDLDSHPHVTEPPGSRLFLPPGSVSNSSQTELILSQQDWDSILAKRALYIAVVKVTYTDSKTNEQHWSRGCLQYFPEGFVPQLKAGFYACDAYNGGD